MSPIIARPRLPQLLDYRFGLTESDMNARSPTDLPAIDHNALDDTVTRHWDSQIIPRLIDYIRVPAKSPHFDPDWVANGYIDSVIRSAESWVRAQNVPGITLEVIRLDGRTPVLFFDIPATGGVDPDRTVLLYGHLDKQPEMTGWREADGLGPLSPVIEDGKLYGRGGADDGYAVYAALSAILALDAQGVARPRCIGLIETCEESGSYDLPTYLDALAPRMGDVRLVVALDSGCGNYDQMWVTTSLRGLVNGTLNVRILTEGVHSGDAGGVVPSSFRIARALLDRIDDSRTGVVTSSMFHCAIPAERVSQAKHAADILGDLVWQRFPWACGDAGAHESHMAQPVTKDRVDVILSRTWRAALAVTGADGLPPIASAGNVQRPFTALKLSLRLPPLIDGLEAAEEVKRLLESDPPYSAVVSFEADSAATGWNAPPVQPWLAAALEQASQAFYGKPAAYIGEGGTIPFMGMLGAKFPAAQLLVTGVLGPKSNAHGPNEFLHLAYAKKLTAAVACVIAAVR